jgi:hypothetical protein
MTTARLTLGAVLGTIGSTASTVTGVLDSINTGAGMLNDYVTNAAENQRLNMKADKVVTKKTIIERMALEQMNRRIEITKICSKSKEHASLYQEAYDEFKDIFSDEEKA